LIDGIILNRAELPERRVGIHAEGDAPGAPSEPDAG
jgi:hypothetical protein